MNKKKILAVVCIILLIAATCTLIIINKKSGKGGSEVSYSSIEEANNAADFNLEHSDRLCGYPATDYSANSSTIEVHFGEHSYIRKTRGVNDNSSNSKNLTETSEAEINGRKVTFKGKDKKIYLATWNHNNFAYTISLDENGSGADVEEMTEYIEATY